MSQPTIFTGLSSIPSDRIVETIIPGSPRIMGFINEADNNTDANTVSKNGKQLTVSIITEYTDDCAPRNNICEPASDEQITIQPTET